MTMRQAVSAVLISGEDIFMIERQPYLRAFPGYHAFPGGKVDKDEETRAFELPFLRDYSPTLMRALCRELREELAFDLEAAIVDGRVTGFSKLCMVTTPPFHRYRFETWFFKITLKSRPQFQVDTQEAKRHEWKTGTGFVELFKLGRILVVPPILRMLQVLAENIHAAEATNADFTWDADTEVPAWEALHQFWHLPILSNTLPPADRTNAFIVGGFLVDPSPRADEYPRLMNVLKRFDLKGIFLTHHHTDHYEHADQIARVLGLPIHISEDSHERILARQGSQFFDGISIHHRRDGEELTRWIGKPVLIHAVPGHDAGQLALAPDTLEWFIVGDLIQGMGTVVIAPPEGNMKAYMQTLQRVINLNPRIIFPSHGNGMGGVHRLKATLKHRQQREEQVLGLYRDGHNEEAMLEQIYQDLHPGLKPLALMNIQAHLAKLREEGLVDAS